MAKDIHRIAMYDRKSFFEYTEKERLLLVEIFDNQVHIADQNRRPGDLSVTNALLEDTIEECPGFRKVIWADFENMPLYVNDPDVDARAAALWRLKIGR